MYLNKQIFSDMTTLYVNFSKLSKNEVVEINLIDPLNRKYFIKYTDDNNSEKELIVSRLTNEKNA